jgi:FHA domain
LVALCLGAALLMAENVWGLRGRWWRDLSWVPLGAAVLGAVGALVGQGFYAILPDAPTSRAWGWALLGIAAGWMLGLADRSRAKSVRGALGGFAGGFIGGFAFDLLSGLNFGGGDTGALPRLLASAVLGFAIGLMMQLAQQAFKSAWLTGLTTGPYEGKQYILAKQTVSVGRSDGNDIGLYREKDLALKAGSFAFANGQWAYQGEPVPINGTPTSSSQVSSGDTIRFGQTEFLFEERGKVVTQAPAALEAESDPLQTSFVPIAPTPTSPLSSPAPTPVPTPAISSQVVSSPAPASSGRWRLVGEQLLELPAAPARATLGRSDDNTLVIREPSVSSHHAVLEIGMNALTVTDLGSTNGVIVNDAKIAVNTPTVLRPGDRVVFGTKKFTVRN